MLSLDRTTLCASASAAAASGKKGDKEGSKKNKTVIAVAKREKQQTERAARHRGTETDRQAGAGESEGSVADSTQEGKQRQTLKGSKEVDDITCDSGVEERNRSLGERDSCAE